MDSQERTLVAAGNQLYRLNRDLFLQETVNLSSPAVGISLSSGGEWLVVCTRLSCTVYNTSDLNSVINTISIELGVRDHVAVFTAGDTSYVGNVTLHNRSGTMGEILLRQYNFEKSYSLHSRDFLISESVKMADFGLSEDVYNTGYFRQNKDDAVRLPFKWMAPESLEDGIFSVKTDVVC